MNEKITTKLIFIILIITISSSIVQSQKLCANIIYVDDDNITGPWDGSINHPYQFIMDALNITADIIYVFNGTYYENIVINSPIKLQGESKYKTIIDGKNINDTVTINSENVIIKNFTITNSSNTDKTLWWKAGIRIIKSNCTIVDNIIKNNLLGIFGKQVTNITIKNNRFYNDSINFYSYDTGNHNHPKLHLDYFIHNIHNNTVNGKPLIYITNKNYYEITSEIGQIIAINCSNLKIHNISIYHSDFPILLINCFNCVIENSNFLSNNGPITLLQSNNNLIKKNNISNEFHGILLDYNSCENKITNNNIYDNRFCGIVCESYSNNNFISKNNLINSKNKNAFVIFSYQNHWINNYWDNWIGLKYNSLTFLPKIIYGQFRSINLIFPYNFDLNPSLVPNLY